MTTHTLVTLVQNRSGLLNRIVNLFRRHDVTVESITIHPTDQHGIGTITMVISADSVARIIAELHRLIEVLEVTEMTHDPSR